MDIVSLVFALFISACIVSIWNNIKEIRRIRSQHPDVEQLKNQLIEEMIAQFEAKIVRLVAEQHGEQIFLYELNTKQFVCKGRNLEELRVAFLERYPERFASIDEGPEELLEEITANMEKFNASYN